MGPKRIRIPTLSQLIGDARPADFQHLRTPMSERGITPEDLGTANAHCRPDLVPIVLQSGSCDSPRMTRAKVFNGKIRKRARLKTPSGP